MKKLNTQKLILCSLFVALISIGAFIRIPVPVVPFTLQYLFTMLAGLLLGPQAGALAVTTYTLLGLAGLPVFTNGGGIGYIFQPSFGYIIGFIAGAFITGKIAHSSLISSLKPRLLVANLVGLLAVYALGLSYYYLISNLYLDAPIAFWPLFLYGFLLAVPGDILLCLVGVFLGARLLPLIKKGA